MSQEEEEEEEKCIKGNDPDHDWLCNSNPMKRLEAAIFEAVNSDQRKHISKEAFAGIKGEIFSLKYHSLDHPPYSQMIYKAIDELNKKGSCSNESALYANIKLDQNHNLPWGHESFLSHHLGLLKRKGEIFEASDGCYTLPNQIHRHLDFLEMQQPNKTVKNDEMKVQFAEKDQDLIPKPTKKRGRKPKKNPKLKKKIKGEIKGKVKENGEPKKRRGRKRKGDKMKEKYSRLKENENMGVKKRRRKQKQDGNGGKGKMGEKKEMGQAKKRKTKAAPAATEGADA